MGVAGSVVPTLAEARMGQPLRLGVRAGEKQILRCAKDDSKKSTAESEES